MKSLKMIDSLLTPDTPSADSHTPLARNRYNHDIRQAAVQLWQKFLQTPKSSISKTGISEFEDDDIVADAALSIDEVAG